MHDFIQHGAKLWHVSHSGKIQNYYDNGTFLFYRENGHDRDILLGPVAKLRNILIQKFTDTAPAWQFAKNESGWRAIEGAERVLLYRGHEIPLFRTDPTNPALTVECRFGYRQLTLRLPTGIKPLVIPYPDEATLIPLRRGLESFHDNLKNASSEAALEPSLARALDDTTRITKSLVEEMQSSRPPMSPPVVTASPTESTPPTP